MYRSQDAKFSDGIGYRSEGLQPIGKMRTREERRFQIPIDELRAVLEKQHGVDLTGIDPYVEGDHIVFSVGQVSSESTEVETLTPRSLPKPELPLVRSKRRLRRRRRNRIKTRGWRIVEKITNSQGLKANVYEPFVSALQGLNGTRAEFRELVRGIMQKNGNSPAPESVDYFLDNTLEYLRRRPQSEVPAS